MPARKRSLGFVVVFGAVLAVVGPVSQTQAGPMNWSRVRGNWVIWVPINPSAEGAGEPSRTSLAATPAPAPAPIAIATPVQSPPPQWWQYTPPSPATSSDSTTLSGFTAAAPATVSPSPSPPPPAAMVPSLTATPVATFSTPSVTSHLTTASAPADAFVNFGSGPYPEASALTTGTAHAWYNSPSVQAAFGGTPNAQQQSDFTGKVLQDVQQTFKLAGLNPTLTLDPNAPSNHTLSVVSGASYTANPGAIGITDVGANGFGFIDKLSYAQNTDQLAWAVAHNVAHELMHAFGVAVHHDQTGKYIDSGTASWGLLTDPNTTFSAAASSDVASHLAGSVSSSMTLGAQTLNAHGHPTACQCPLCKSGTQLIPPPIPEPATWASWSLALAAVVARRARARAGRPKSAA